MFIISNSNMYFFSVCLFILFIVILLIFIQINHNSIENFEQNEDSDTDNQNNKLMIKKTKQFSKIFYCDKYTIWEAKPKENYYPIGHYITTNNEKPNIMAILVKNQSGVKSKDKPFKFDIISITNKNWGIWKPIPNEKYISLGHIYNKEYPSKYFIRCIEKKFCKKSNLKMKLVENSISSLDKGYELWSINNSDLFICNNLNNANYLEEFKNIYTLKEDMLDVYNRLYVKTTNKYKAICQYVDETNKSFKIWRPIPPENFCSLGDICLDSSINPNKKIDTIVAHKSVCKLCINFGKKSIYSLEDKDNSSKSINFWRPKPHEDHYFLSDIVVVGDKEPESDDLIYCISIDYIKYVNQDTHKMVYNNIDNKKPLSIWIDDHNFMSINNKYDLPLRNHYVLNTKFTKGDTDLLDIRKSIIIGYREHKNIKKISKEQLQNFVIKNLSDKLDINVNRIDNLSINSKNKQIELTLNPRLANKKELSIDEILNKLNKILDNSEIKIFNEKKDTFYIILEILYVKESSNEIQLDNSLFKNKFN